MNILEIKDLVVEYRIPEGIVRAIDNIDLFVKKGEVLAVVGESGSGKSTLAYSIVRLLPRNARIVKGSIIFNTGNESIDLVKVPENIIRSLRGYKIGVVFQDPMTFLNPVMKIEDQIIEAMLTHRDISRDEARNKVINILKRLRIPNPEYIARSYPHQLSGGMKQRVMIAMAIANEPDLLIADEPTSALDVTVQAEILNLFKYLQEEMDLSIILITHDLGVAARIADRIAIMYAGKVVEVGDVEEVFHDPLHPYTQGLLGSILTIEERSFSKGYVLRGLPPNMINPPRGCRFHPRCPYIMKGKCEIYEPHLINLGGRYVACWLYER
ncbi:MAG: ABC transporter ATP-binding protein [Sulfolobales archaeon]